MEQILDAAAQEALIKHLRVARQNLVAFRWGLLTHSPGEVDPAEFHFEWSNILLKGNDNFAIEGFRESGKGQLALRSLLLYALRFPSPALDYIVLIKANQDLANQKLIEIEEEFLSNPALCSGVVKIEQKSAKIFNVIVKDDKGAEHNVRIEAYGKGSSVRGLAYIDRRPRLVIIDDPQDLEDSRSDTVMDADWRWFTEDVMFLGKYTRIFLIGNNLGEKCIIERVFANSESLRFKTRRISILDEQGKPTWPARFPLEFIEREREAFRKTGEMDVWMRQRMCMATSAETRTFNRDDFMRYSQLYLDDRIRGEAIFITVDPASSKEPGACYRAICVNAVSVDNRWTIVDFPYGRWQSDIFVDKLFEVVALWTPFLENKRRMPVGIEKGLFKQILEPFIYKEMQRRNIFFDIHEIEHAKMGNKLQRVQMLAPLFKAHSIWLPEEAPWLAELESELLGVTREGFKSLFVDLCFAKGTKIATLCGDKNIEDITLHDIIITPFGCRKVKACGLTGYSETIQKMNLEATPNHKIFCYENGFVSMDTLCYTNHISRYSIKEAIRWRYLKLLYSMEKSSTWMGRESITDLIRSYPMIKSVGMDCIRRFGNFIINGKFLKAGMFIISIAMSIITTYLTWSVYHLSNITRYLKILILSALSNIWLKSDRLRSHGIDLLRAGCGIDRMLSILRKTKNHALGNAIYAANNISISTPLLDIALQGVCRSPLPLVEDYTRNEPVLSAAKNSNVGNIYLLKPAKEVAPLNMVGSIQPSAKGVKPVYNLTIETDGVYYANGILVSNCDTLAMQLQLAKPPVGKAPVVTGQFRDPTQHPVMPGARHADIAPMRPVI